MPDSTARSAAACCATWPEPAGVSEHRLQPARCCVDFEGEPHPVGRLASHEMWMAFFRDPDRNLLALMSEAPV